MSSLLQHHGTIKRGRVELLMYLHFHHTYYSCDRCGKKQALSNTVCEGCNKPFSQRFYKQSKEDKYNQMEVIIPYEERPYGSSDSEASICQRSSTYDSEPVRLVRPDGTISICSKLYRIWRKPVEMWGAWVVFRWNGTEHAPDLSVPIGVDVLPRDAEELTDEEAIKYWFST